MRDQQGQGQTFPHWQHCTIHSTTRATGNHHQDRSRESDSSRVPWTSLATDTSAQRRALGGLASLLVPQVTEPPSAPHVEPEH